MDISSLECFIEVIKDLNMTAASKRLYISQQALSLKIQRLEREYGVQLFERKPKLKLTYAGKIFAERAKIILQENQKLMNQLSDININQSAVLNLGIPSSRTSTFLPDVLKRFHVLWPNVSLHLIDEPTSKLFSMLDTGSLDVAVVVPTNSEISIARKKFDLTLLMQEKVYVVTSRAVLDHYLGSDAQQIIEQASRGTDLREFCQIPFILHKPPLNLRKFAEECFHEAGYKPKIYIEATTTEVITSIYSCHLGMFFCRGIRLPMLLARFPDCCAFPVKRKGSLAISKVYLAQARYRHPPKYLQDFSKLMVMACKNITNGVTTR